MDTQTYSERTTYSVLGSGLLHAGLTVAILTMNLTPPEVPKLETIEIQVPDRVPAPIHRASTPTVTRPSTPGPAQASRAHSAPIRPRATLTPATTTSPDLDTSDFEQSLTAPTSVETVGALEDSELNESLSLAEQQASAQMNASASDLPEVDAVMAESEALAQQAREQENQRAAVMAQTATQLRAQEQTRLQKLKEEQARARAAAELRHQQAAQLQARQRAEAQDRELRAAQAQYQAARAAAIQAARAAAKEYAREQDMAGSDGGSLQGSLKDNGSGRIRTLEELRQMPGNKRPQYDTDDRLAGRTGDVIFRAFISKEGLPTQFELIQSSGHRTLDAKTYKAIRDWKFYPGQEGWVEIPFRWDLKGEPRPIGGTLRKVSQK